MTHEATVKRLCLLYRTAIPPDRKRGREWYALERKWIEAQIDELAPHVPYRHGCTIYAALSPQTPWERNRRLVQAVLRGDTYPGGVFRRSWDRAEAAIHSGPLVLGGPKVIAFDCNLAGCKECLTLDTHMHKIARAPYATTDYAWLDHAYRAAARRCKALPAEFQATLWLAYRPDRPLDPDERT